MDQFQISEKLQLERLLFIDKGYHDYFLSWLHYYLLFNKACWYRVKNYSCCHPSTWKRCCGIANPRQRPVPGHSPQQAQKCLLDISTSFFTSTNQRKARDGLLTLHLSKWLKRVLKDNVVVEFFWIIIILVMLTHLYIKYSYPFFIKHYSI